MTAKLTEEEKFRLESLQQLYDIATDLYTTVEATSPKRYTKEDIRELKKAIALLLIETNAEALTLTDQNLSRSETFYGKYSTAEYTDFSEAI